MNDHITEQIDRQLRIHVERIVRPIIAAEYRKDRMREDLLSHMIEAYVDEMRDGRDDDAAIRIAMARLGDPSALQKQLRTSVPIWERVLFMGKSCNPAPTRWARGMHRHTGESALRHAVRATGMSLVISLQAGTVVAALHIAVGRGSFTNLVAGLPAVLIVVGVCAIAVLASTLMIPALHRAMESFHHGCWMPIVLQIVFVMLLTGGTCAMIRAVYFDWKFVLASDLWLWMVAVLLSPVHAIFVGQLAWRERARFERWTGLDLTEAA